jgi:hypothetical protein
MRSAKDERDATFVGEYAIAAIAVDLKDPGKARKMSDGTLRLSVRRIDIGDARRIGSLPWPVVARIFSQTRTPWLAAALLSIMRT